MIGVKRSNWIKNTSLVIASFAVMLGLTEIILRLFVGDALYSGRAGRSLYYSSPNLERVKSGAVHYVPDTLIRSITVYYNQIEYDTRHKTNNLGFFDHRDYTIEPRNGILFIGDSFTAGVGASRPWLPVLNDRYPDINLYNLGVTGTGQENFYRLFENFQDDLNYSTVVILSISDDLDRKLWYPLEANHSLYFCLEKSSREECLKSRPVATLIDRDIDAKSLLIPNELYLKKAYRLLKSRLHALKEQIGRKGDTEKKGPQPYGDLVYIAKIKSLAKEKGKRVLFVHIPEKSEVSQGYYRYDIAQRVRDLGIEYYPLMKDNHFDMSMYYPHDGHPNDKGYAYISSLVEKILKLKQK